MKNMRIDIWTVPSNDQQLITSYQKKINQWMTDGTLVKYEIHTTANEVIFNVCRRKSE